MADEELGTEQPEQLANDASVEPESSPGEVDADADTSAEPEGSPKKTPWFQRRIDEVTAEKWDLKRQNEQLLALLQQGQQRQPDPTPAPTGKPELESFSSYEEYTEALADWKVEQKFAEIEQRRNAETAAQAAARQEAEFAQRVRQAIAVQPEIERIVNDPSLPVSQAMAEVIRAAENGPQMLAALDANREQAARIYAMSPQLAAFELGRLAAGIQPPQPRRVTVPPKPINTLGGGASPTPFDPSTITNGDEYKRWREADMKAKRNAQ